MRKGKHDISPWVRYNTLKAIRHVMHDKGMTASEVIAEEIKEHGLIEWLKVAAKFNVQEKRVEGTVSHEHQHTISKPVSATDALIGEIIREDTDMQESVPDKLILPPPVRTQ